MPSTEGIAAATVLARETLTVLEVTPTPETPSETAPKQSAVTESVLPSTEERSLQMQIAAEDAESVKHSEQPAPEGIADLSAPPSPQLEASPAVLVIEASAPLIVPEEMVSISASSEPVPEVELSDGDLAMNPLFEALVEPAAPSLAEVEEMSFEDSPPQMTLEKPAKSPDELYNRFVNALLGTDAGETPGTLLTAETDDPCVEIEAPSVPPILCVEVAGRLLELEPAEKEIALPLVQTIVMSVQRLRTLEGLPDVELETASIKAYLVDVTTELCRVMGVDYDDERIAQFMQYLLRPDFALLPGTPAETLLPDDAESWGTHEIKRHFSVLNTTLTDEVETERGTALGGIVLSLAFTGNGRDASARRNFAMIGA